MGSFRDILVLEYLDDIFKFSFSFVKEKALHYI